MTDHDDLVAEILFRVKPSLNYDLWSWGELNRRAGRTAAIRTRPLRPASTATRRTAVLLAATVIVALGIAIPAVALSNNWWFLGTGAPNATSNIMTVTSGRWADIDWTVTAYLSADDGVCVALTPAVGDGKLGASACGTGLRGEFAHDSTNRGTHWVGYDYFDLGLYDFPDAVFGTTADGVDRVNVVLSDGQSISVPIVHRPSDFPVPVDFYVVALPRGASVESVVALDRSGEVLEKRSCTDCSSPR